MVRDINGLTSEKAMIHIPIVQKMIALHSKDIDKLGINHPDYIWSEFGVCLLLDNTINRSVKQMILLIASCLHCNPILLCNDAEFMAYVQSRVS